MQVSRETYRQFCLPEASIPIYRNPDWLDTVCGPTGWGAALSVDQATNQLEFALTFQIGRKYRLLRIVHTPLWTPYVGPFLAKDPHQTPGHRFLHWYNNQVRQAMLPLKGVRYIQWKLHHSLPHDLPFRWTGLHNRPRVTYVIEPGQVSEEHLDRLDKNLRRDIRQAQRKYQVIAAAHLEEFTSKAIDHLYLRAVGGLPAYRHALISLLAKYRNDESMQALIALDDQGRTVAGALFVADERYVYYLLGFRDESLRNNQGNTLLLWHGIEWALKTNRYFDFEGSSIPGVAHYFRRFGGEQRLCLEVYRP